MATQEAHRFSVALKFRPASERNANDTPPIPSPVPGSPGDGEEEEAEGKSEELWRIQIPFL